MKVTKTLNVVERIRRRVLADADAAAGYCDQQEIRRLGREIRSLRESRQLTQDEVAHLARMTQADVSRLENGLLVRGCTIGTLVRLSGALGFNITLEPLPSAAIVEDVVSVDTLPSAAPFKTHDATVQPKQVTHRRLVHEA